MLLAEDDQALRVLLSSLLRKDGHRVVETSDGDQLVLAHAGLPAGRRGRTVVVSDLAMPNQGGLEACEEIRAQDQSVGLVLMGAFSEVDDEERARALKAAMLVKPFELSRLRRLVRELMADPSASASAVLARI
ncbi:MAG TPA: response regulator [Myxococcaceae bacterium]|nr:response regulator [Myxococcaceae bacterium]